MGLIADVFDVVLIDPLTGDAFGSTTLTDGQIQVQVQENEVRAGKGNQLQAVLHAQRDITIQLTDVELNYDFVAHQFGQDIVTGAGVAYATPKHYTVSGNSITLDNSISASEPNSLVIHDANDKPITGFTVTGNTVNLSAATPTVADKDSIQVVTYAYDSDAKTEKIEFDGSVFAKGLQVILETYEIDGNENITHKLQYQFDNAVMNGNFTLNTQSAKQAVTNQTTLKVVKPSNTDIVGRSLRIPYTG